VVRGRGLICYGIGAVLLLFVASRARAQLPEDGGARDGSVAAPQPAPLTDGGALDGSMEPAPATGTIDVLSTPPGVAVEIDGAAKGLTPLVGTQLPPGPHRLRLHGPNLKTQEQTVEIQAGQNVRVSLTLGAVEAKSPSFLGTPVDVPLATTILAGTAAALFGVGLGFGIAANDVQHQAGVNVSPRGVDLGLTRAQALQGKQYAQIANGFYIGASVALVTAVVLAVVLPHHHPEPAPEAPAQASPNLLAPGVPPLGSTW
jgi:hypothetical protein